MGHDTTDTDALAAGNGTSVVHGSPDLTESPSAVIERLERELAAVAPRLEAFGKLENLAREQRTTPEAIAVQVTIDVLAEEREELQEEVERLAAAKAANEDALALLARERDETDEQLRAAQSEYQQLVEETTELLTELDSIRSDAVRLLGEKAALEIKVETLRNDVELVAQEHEAVAGTDPGGSSVLSTERAQASATAEPSKFESIDDSDEAHAFDKFFEVDTGKDKARAWMLE